MAHYGQESPINYDLTKVLPAAINVNLIDKKFRVVQNFFQVTAPTAIFKGDADDLADVEDINRLVGINQNHVYHVSENHCHRHQ